MRELLRRLHLLWHRDQFEQELDEEMRHHLALKAEETGSRWEANQRFGNVTLWKEDSRAMWTWRFAEQLWQDIRYAGRMMAANRLFTAMAVLSLALGIGANTAIYSFVEAILLRTLPVDHPEQLVLIQWRTRTQPRVVYRQRGTRNGNPKTGIVSPDYPYAAFEILKQNPDVFSALFAYAYTSTLNVVLHQRAEARQGLGVSGGFFAGLGTAPAAGRLIQEADDRTGAPPVAVLSYDYWKKLGRDPSLVGQSVMLNNVPFVIAGVAPPDFGGMDLRGPAEVFVPMHSMPLLAAKPAEAEKEDFFDNHFYWVEMVGRLRPGVEKRRAEAVLGAQYHRFAESTATTEKERTTIPELWLQDGRSGTDSLRRQYEKSVWVLMTMVGLILTIACANIANLLLARAAARKQEMAVRLSLGAGRARIIRQLLTESVLLSLTGGLVGLLVAHWGIEFITWLLSNGHEDFPLHAGLNLPVLGFTLALALVTGVVFGLAPAIRATRLDLTPALKDSRGSERRSGRRWGVAAGLGQFLVVAQIAISLLLVVGAALFVRSLASLNAVDLGFNRENLLLFDVNARQAGYKPNAIGPFYAGLLDRFRNIPGVRSAALSDYPLVAGRWNGTGLDIPGRPNPSKKRRDTCVVKVDSAFLSTMQIPILLGRGIEERDLGSPKVAVVSEVFVKEFFGTENPIGRMIALGEGDPPADIQIIGVARAAHYNAVQEASNAGAENLGLDTQQRIPSVVYLPYTQNPESLGVVTFEVRTAGDPLAITNTIRQLVHDSDPNIPVTSVTTQARKIEDGISQQRTFANLCSCFAVLALLIACVGLYGTMAYTVARRTSEIGIRMALGAGRQTIIWMVMREVFVLAAVGLAIGLAATRATTHLVASFLFGTKPNDPRSLVISIAILTAAAIVAGYAPARRAARTEPMSALRHQ